MLFQALFLVFATLASMSSGFRTKLHMMLQAEPDKTCQDWLASPDGRAFVQCDESNPGGAQPGMGGAGNNTNTGNTTNTGNNSSSNCQITQADFDSYCNDNCFQVMNKAYDFFLESKTCLPVYQDKYKPCMNNTDCPPLGNGKPRICFEGFCYNACNTTNDCDACMNETCEMFGQGGMNGMNGTQGNVNGTQGTNGTQGGNGTQAMQMQACRNPFVQYVKNGSALGNRTIETTFKGMIMSLRAGCAKDSKEANGTYCAMKELSDNQTCESLNSEWGCCATTMLYTMKFCEWRNFTNTNYSRLLDCNFTQPPCGGLPWPQQYCIVNTTNNNTTNNNTNPSSSSSSTSSDMGSGSPSGSSSMVDSSSAMSSSPVTSSSPSSSLILPSSPLSSLTGMSSHNHHSGSSGIGSPGNGASGQAVISWTMTVALALTTVAVHIMS
jgi:hypothetical protein